MCEVQCASGASLSERARNASIEMNSIPPSATTVPTSSTTARRHLRDHHHRHKTRSRLVHTHTHIDSINVLITARTWTVLSTAAVASGNDINGNQNYRVWSDVHAACTCPSSRLKSICWWVRTRKRARIRTLTHTHAYYMRPGTLVSHSFDRFDVMCVRACDLTELNAPNILSSSLATARRLYTDLCARTWSVYWLGVWVFVWMFGVTWNYSKPIPYMCAFKLSEYTSKD